MAILDKVKINTKKKTQLFFDFLRNKRSVVFFMAVFIICISVLLLINTYSRQSSNPGSLDIKNSISAKPAPVISNEATNESIPAKIEPPASAPSSSLPSPDSLLNLMNWKLTLPINTDHSGNPDEIKWPELETFTSPPFFQLNSQKNGIVFQAPVGGTTTAHSNYPRSELREMSDGGAQEASWSSTSGSHTMLIREAVTHLPDAKPEVVAGQIHDVSSDILMVRLERQNLFIQSDGQNISTLDPSYVLGTPFTIELRVGDGHIKVFYNGKQKIDYRKSGDGYYFKAGCYTQSNASKGDSADAYGEVVIYDLKVTHS